MLVKMSHFQKESLIGCPGFDIKSIESELTKSTWILWTHQKEPQLFNKRGGGAKVAKSLNVEVGFFWKKLVHNSNKWGVEGGKI